MVFPLYICPLCRGKKKNQTSKQQWFGEEIIILNSSEIALNLTSARKYTISSTSWISCLKSCIHSSNIFFATLNSCTWKISFLKRAPGDWGSECSAACGRCPCHQVAPVQEPPSLYWSGLRRQLWLWSCAGDAALKVLLSLGTTLLVHWDRCTNLP